MASGLCLPGRSRLVLYMLPRIVISAFRGSAVVLPLFSLLRGCTPIGCRCAECVTGCPAWFTRSLPFICAASGRAPPFRLSSFPYPRVPVLYDSIAAGPRQAAVATPVAGGCRFVPVGALVLGPYALPLRCGPCLRWIFGCFSALFRFSCVLD